MASSAGIVPPHLQLSDNPLAMAEREVQFRAAYDVSCQLEEWALKTLKRILEILPTCTKAGGKLAHLDQTLIYYGKL